MIIHFRAIKRISTQFNAIAILSSFIQTILSASESHRIMPFGPWAVPPVGN